MGRRRHGRVPAAEEGRRTARRHLLLDARPTPTTWRGWSSPASSTPSCSPGTRSGFHQQSHSLRAARRSGATYEDLRRVPRARSFRWRRGRASSLLVMKPFAGGLLCRGKALPPHDWYRRRASRSPPGRRAAADSRAARRCRGRARRGLGGRSRGERARRASAARRCRPRGARIAARGRVACARSFCSRCGDCETTCSHALPIPAMFRDAYIWTSRNETSMANATENYFDLHPAVGADVRDVHRPVLPVPAGHRHPVRARPGRRAHARLAQRRQHPGPRRRFAERTIDGAYRVHVLTAEVPSRLAPGARGRRPLPGAERRRRDGGWRRSTRRIAPRPSASASRSTAGSSAVDPAAQHGLSGRASPVVVRVPGARAAGRHAIEVFAYAAAGRVGGRVDRRRGRVFHSASASRS